MRLASSSPDGSFVCRVDSKPPQPRSSPGVGAPSPVSERKAATGRLGSNRFATSASVARNQARLMDALGAWRGPSLDDRNVDLVQEGIDVGLPVGPQADSTLTARRIATATLVAASPSNTTRSRIRARLRDLYENARLGEPMASGAAASPCRPGHRRRL